MRRAIWLSVLLLTGCSARASNVDEAIGLYGRNKVAAAEEALHRIAADPKQSQAEKAAAHRELGRIAWPFLAK